MPQNKDDYPYTWKDFEGKIASAVYRAPRTGGDPGEKWPQVHSRVIGYIIGQVVGKPWADHLTLMVMIFTAQRRDVATVEVLARQLNTRFSSLFPLFNLHDASQWNVAQHLVPYVQGNTTLQDSLSTRVTFYKQYMSVTNMVASWLDFLPVEQQEMYRPFLLPPVNPFLAKEFSKLEQEWERQQKAHRKEETEAIVPQFTDLRAEAHFRYNRIHRLWLAYQQAREQVLPDYSNLPMDFSYEEGDPPIERIVCRLWDRRSFVLDPDHACRYRHATVGYARKRQHSFTDEHNELFLEIINIEQLEKSIPPEGFWFTDILQHGVFGARARFGLQRELEEKQAWLRQWDYGEDDPKKIVSPFETHQPGLLTWPDPPSGGGSSGNFMSEAQRHTDGILVPVDPFHAATTFGLLALELLTTTGMRINELMQVSLLPECIIRVVDDPPPGASDQTPRIRYLLRLLPKGERTEKRHHYGIGKDALRLMTQTAQMLCEQYQLHPGEPLPRVAFSYESTRRHRFEGEKIPYIFSVPLSTSSR